MGSKFHPPTHHKLNMVPRQMSLTVRIGVEIPTRPLDHLHLAMAFQITMPMPQRPVPRLNITQHHTTKTQPGHPAQNPHTSRRPLCAGTPLSIRPVQLPAVQPLLPNNTHLPGMCNRRAILCHPLRQHFISRQRALLSLTITRHNPSLNNLLMLCHLHTLRLTLDNRGRMDRKLRNRLISNQHGPWRKT